MAISTTQDKGAITKYGGGKMWVKEVNDDGTDLAIPDTWHLLPYIEKSTFTITANNEDYKDETGEVIASVESDFNVKFSGIFLQCDKATLDFLAKEVKGKFYAVIVKRGTVNGKEQEIAFGIAKFKRGFTDETGVRKPPFEFIALKNTGSTISISTPPSGVSATSFSIGVGEYYDIKET